MSSKVKRVYELSCAIAACEAQLQYLRKELEELVDGPSPSIQTPNKNPRISEDGLTASIRKYMIENAGKAMTPQDVWVALGLEERSVAVHRAIMALARRNEIQRVGRGLYKALGMFE